MQRVRLHTVTRCLRPACRQLNPGIVATQAAAPVLASSLAIVSLMRTSCAPT